MASFQKLSTSITYTTIPQSIQQFAEEPCGFRPPFLPSLVYLLQFSVYLRNLSSRMHSVKIYNVIY
jgi:ABC-type uncharacterized transport system fused permease/ATPase subunit